MDKLMMIKDNNENLSLTNEELNAIVDNFADYFLYHKSINSEKDIEAFFKERLFIFRTKKEVFDWFYSNRSVEDIYYDLQADSVTQNLVGMTMLDAFLRKFEYDNYNKLSDNLYVTWIS